MPCRSSTCPSTGWHAGLRFSIPPRHRSPAPFPKPGGASHSGEEGASVILNDPRSQPAFARIGARMTLDEMLHRAALRRPDGIALLDPPNRDGFTDGKPRQLTYAQADRLVSAIAGR